MANPQVKISVVRHSRAPAVARRLSQAEADAALQRYIAAHPRAWASLSEVVAHSLDGRVGPPNTALPMVELRLQ
jgi:hypothetical protein